MLPRIILFIDYALQRSPCRSQWNAASRFLPAAAVCGILFSFATEGRKSYWSGCIKGTMVIWQQLFLHLGADDFLLMCLVQFLFKSASKSSFFPRRRRDPGFGAAISDAAARNSRERLRRVLRKKAAVIYIFTPSHLLIYIFTPSHLLIYIFTLSHLLIYIFTPSHLLIYIFTP